MFKSLLLLFAFIPVLFSAFAQTISGLVINEILFNPARDGYDYVELYNSGNDTIELQNVLIGNRNGTHDISALKPLSKNTLKAGPGKYIVVTSNDKWVRQNYTVSPDAIICTISQMPSYPDDKGTVILLMKPDSAILDEVSYSEKWHFALLNDPSGVALERINYAAASQDANNWTSASTTSGYGTPGYQNSQFRQDLQAKAEISLTPAIFSPDNDGINDFAFITLLMKEPGYLVNTVIYDASGRRVRYLLKNEILGLQNRFKWDGYDDNFQRLPRGVYLFFTTVFNLSGQTKKFKNVIVLNYKI